MPLLYAILKYFQNNPNTKSSITNDPSKFPKEIIKEKKYLLFKTYFIRNTNIFKDPKLFFINVAAP